MIGVKGTRREVEDNLDFFIPDPLNRKSYPSKPEEVIIICIAQKQEYMRFQYPLQMKYAGDRKDKTLFQMLQRKYEKTKKTTILDGNETNEFENK